MSIWLLERYLSADELRTSGILQEANRQFFHPLGLALEVDLGTETIRLRDGREDPEGWIFGEGVMTAENCRRFEEFAAPRALARIKRFGYVVQSSPTGGASKLMISFERALSAVKEMKEREKDQAPASDPPPEFDPSEKIYTPPPVPIKD